MEEKIYFISRDKSFELINIGDEFDRWFKLIERGRRFTSTVKIDKENI